MNNADLDALLASRCLPTGGKKQEKLARLYAQDAEHAAQAAAPETTIQAAAARAPTSTESEGAKKKPENLAKKDMRAEVSKRAREMRQERLKKPSCKRVLSAADYKHSTTAGELDVESLAKQLGLGGPRPLTPTKHSDVPDRLYIHVTPLTADPSLSSEAGAKKRDSVVSMVSAEDHPKENIGKRIFFSRPGNACSPCFLPDAQIGEVDSSDAEIGEEDPLDAESDNMDGSCSAVELPIPALLCLITALFLGWSAALALGRNTEFSKSLSDLSERPRQSITEGIWGPMGPPMLVVVLNQLAKVLLPQE